MLNKGLLRGAGIALGLVFGLVGFTEAAGLPNVKAAQPPAWVNKISPHKTETYHREELRDGEYYLLVDHQFKAEKSTTHRYSHYAVLLVNQVGLESNSQLKISFDPTYQTLSLHTIQLRRDGHVIDQLDMSKSKLIQKEEDLEYQLYDGRVTFLHIFEDLRVGDVVEYSYTLHGRNPALENLYSQFAQLQWSVPVGELYVRFFSDQMKLNYKLLNTNEEFFTDLSRSGYSEFLIHRKPLPAKYAERKQPWWYREYPVVQVSNLDSWKTVANWAVRLYPDLDSPSEKIRAVGKRIWHSAHSKEERILSAIRFVQDEVRYMGIELGVGSYIPSHPNVTLSRRFGDCKDKTYLLVSLLKELSIDATPVLVNLDRGPGLDLEMPSAVSFDHVIATFEYQGQEYWVDPTETLTGGQLSSYRTTNLGYGLPIKRGGDLRALPDSSPSMPLVDVTESFELTAGFDSPAIYEVLTTYRGEEANYNRSRLAKKGRTVVSKGNLDYYRTYYRDIEQLAEMEVVDDREKNELRVIEKYSIPNFWEKDEKRNRLESDFYATEIDSYMKIPRVEKRNSPKALSHPVYIKQSTVIRLPEEWDIDPEKVSVSNGNFFFSKQLTGTKNIVNIEYVYQSKKDHVLPSEMSAYVKDLKRADSILGVGLYSERPKDDRKRSKPASIFHYLSDILRQM